ncbi:MAG: DUF4428 domain-containing protein [Lachnospiraceae bacterium]|nr:DUF4428 domain-containing protein [Lachnospiraceae bacterium]
MADKCSICGKRAGSYVVKDGAICGKCYDKYTKAGYDFKKKLTVSEIEEVICGEEEQNQLREYKNEDLDKAKGLIYIWGAGFLVGIVMFVILWSDFLGYAIAKEKQTVDAHLVDSYEIENYKEDENGVKKTSVSAKYEYVIDGKTYSLSVSTNNDVSTTKVKVYKKKNGEWKEYLKNPTRHFASLGFLLLSAFCVWMGKSDLDNVIEVLKRKKK